MSIATYQFDEQESQTLERWLKATIMNLLVLPVLLMVLSFFFPFKEGGPYTSVNLGVSLGVEILLFFLFYTYTYKKQGTKLLTFSIVMIILSIPLGLCGVILDGSSHIYASFALVLPPTIWWFILSLRLRKIYKKKKLSVEKLEERKKANFEEQENKTRRYWIFVTFINTVFISLLGMIFSLFSKGLQELYSLQFYVQVMTNIPVFALYYYFTYLKHGTRLLTFSLVVAILAFPLSIGVTIFYGSIQMYVVEVLTLPLSIWWLVLSVRLRKINKKTKLSLSPQT